MLTSDDLEVTRLLIEAVMEFVILAHALIFPADGAMVRHIQPHPQHGWLSLFVLERAGGYSYSMDYKESSGTSVMKMSWQTEADRLVCRWSEVGERIHYKPRWIQDVSRNVHRENVSTSVPDFTRLSPFGRWR
jgi:hypothetical protein